jgi:F-type H+-transporting ATPase subunit gamma
MVRGMATQKQLKQRIKSIRTIIKVTKAMKLVAAARVKTVQVQLNAARVFQADVAKLLVPEEDKQGIKGEKYLLMPVAADKGLCGAVNSVIVRETRRMYRENAPVSAQTKLIAIGSKAIGGLTRQFEPDILFGISEQKPGKRMTFKHVAAITEMIRAADWTRADVVYNRFRNAISYVTTVQPFFRFDPKAPLPKTLVSYEIEGDQDTLRNLDEVRQAAMLWQIWAEAEASELSARVNAMENSSKAAQEMEVALNIKANKLRQSKIKLEICDIVAGAEAAM